MIIKFEYKIVEAIFERIFIFLVNTVESKSSISFLNRIRFRSD